MASIVAFPSTLRLLTLCYVSREGSGASGVTGKGPSVVVLAAPWRLSKFGENSNAPGPLYGCLLIPDFTQHPY